MIKLKKQNFMQPFNLVKSIINGRVSLSRMFFVYSNDKSAAGYKTDKGYITEKYFDTVYRLALSQTKQQHYAEDVTQEVFLKFYKTDKRLNAPGVLEQRTSKNGQQRMNME